MVKHRLYADTKHSVDTSENEHEILILKMATPSTPLCSFAPINKSCYPINVVASTDTGNATGPKPESRINEGASPPTLPQVPGRKVEAEISSGASTPMFHLHAQSLMLDKYACSEVWCAKLARRQLYAGRHFVCGTVDPPRLFDQPEWMTVNTHFYCCGHVDLACKAYCQLGRWDLTVTVGTPAVLTVLSPRALARISACMLYEDWEIPADGTRFCLMPHCDNFWNITQQMALNITVSESKGVAFQRQFSNPKIDVWLAGKPLGQTLYTHLPMTKFCAKYWCNSCTMVTHANTTLFSLDSHLPPMPDLSTMFGSGHTAFGNMLSEHHSLCLSRLGSTCPTPNHLFKGIPVSHVSTPNGPMPSPIGGIFGSVMGHGASPPSHDTHEEILRDTAHANASGHTEGASPPTVESGDAAA